MKINRNLMLAACLVVAGAMAAPTQAGMFASSRNKHYGKGKRTEKTAEQERPRRFNRIPEMTFTRGRLVLSGPGTWQVDNAALQIRKDCVMTQAGSLISVLEEGREVMVAGVWNNGVLEAWNIDVLTLADAVATPNPSRQVKVSDSDPTVGEVISAAY